VLMSLNIFSLYFHSGQINYCLFPTILFCLKGVLAGCAPALLATVRLGRKDLMNTLAYLPGVTSKKESFITLVTWPVSFAMMLRS
jgi:hypothetical protein